MTGMHSTSALDVLSDRVIQAGTLLSSACHQKNNHGSSSLDRVHGSSSPEPLSSALNYEQNGASGCLKGLNVATAVFPRRKPNHKRLLAKGHQATSPVSITLEVLEQLASYSLPTAAAKLGICPTAMKTACRRLGILRWPYFPSRFFPYQADQLCTDSRRKPILCNAETQTDVTCGHAYNCVQACPPPPLDSVECNMKHEELGCEVCSGESMKVFCSSTVACFSTSQSFAENNPQAAATSCESTQEYSTEPLEICRGSVSLQACCIRENGTTPCALERIEGDGSFSNLMARFQQLEDLLYGETSEVDSIDF